jgi:hypothetical protein
MGLFGPPNVKQMEAKRDITGLIIALQYSRGEFWKLRGAAGKPAIGAGTGLQSHARYVLSIAA